MPNSITLGTARSVPGTIRYGQWDAFTHPTGHTEWLPVIIAQGRKDGPCIWLTAGIHGPEHAGPAVLYKLITQELVDQLKGTIVAIPALSPPGLRTMSYVPYHLTENPNRLWPDGRPRQPQDPDKAPPTSVEMTFERLFEEILTTANYLIDYHNAQTGSLSFVFRDRVLYRENQNSVQTTDRNRADAETLAARLDEMIRAYGHTIVDEFPVEKYIDEKLHRSTSGAALLVGKFPAFTVELGTGHMPDPAIVAASAAGTRNVLRWADMLDGELEPIVGIKVVDPGFPARRRAAPRVNQECVVLHLAEPGDIVQAGDPVAELRDIWGRPLLTEQMPDGLLRAADDGFIVGRTHGIYYYPGSAVCAMAIRNDEPLIGPYPEGFFEQSAAN